MLYCCRFDSSVAPLIFADQFIRLSTRLPSPLLYGLGEHEHPFLYNLTTDWQKLTFWTRDVSPTPDTNLYGTISARLLCIERLLVHL
jgi:hypothetical protein